ncbi:MAG TPA: DNA internalization-related competence protein ComEC/Rec2, partial [Casimicrobiaceae bacterium]|nr:DNA internalization-related competence protein ComEC/Rec2 [Casimicrobiaceae bacterium]
EVIGVIDDLPHASARGTRFALAVERIVTSEAHVPARVSLAWYSGLRGGTASDVPPLRAGERWHLTVRLKRPHGNVNPHGFDLEAWLLENELRATGYVRPHAMNVRIAPFAGRPLDWVQRARESVRDRIVAALPDAPYAGVIVALTIGEQRAIPEAQWLVFNRTGITHLISISGLHVTVFAAITAALVHRLVRRSARMTAIVPAHRVAALIGALAAFAYVLLAGAQIPAQRTLVMLVVAAVGLWLARPGSARMVWLWALAIVLVFDPWAGLTPGFWLSFGAVALLLYSGTCRLQSRPASFWDAQRRTLQAAARAQGVVTVGLVPLTLAVFQRVSLIAPLANALAIPVVTFLVVPVALTAIVLPFEWPWQLAHAVFAWLMLPLERLAAWPGTTWQQHAPAPWSVGAAMIGIVWMLAPPGIPLRALGALWLLPLVAVRPLVPGPGGVRVSVLDVGQGLAAVVQTATHTLLYDTGPRFNDDADAGGRIVAPYLHAIGIERLSMLVVSHLDADHSGGTRSIAHTVPIDWRVSSVPHDDRLWQSIGGVERCRAGQTWTWDGVSFAFLHPPPAWYGATRFKTNDMSCVLRVAANGGSVLLTGDIEAKSEMTMVASDQSLATDLLVVPHHGSRTSSTAEFIAAVSPRVAIFTPGYRNQFGHPRAEVLERYRAAGAVLLRTDLQGAIIIDIDPTGATSISAERERQRRYWYDPPRVAEP